MKNEKDMEVCNCGCCGGYGMLGGKKLYMIIGTLALVYGLVQWARVTYMWPPYMGWVVGGAALVVIGFLKKWWYMRKGM
ncbi:MAG TPA: hypothetical protein VEW42_02000 [Candidatus Eisenbacteria bacterium]|nr:hypothetical protein [Candidatus Eisenbacteria bacterium]